MASDGDMPPTGTERLARRSEWVAGALADWDQAADDPRTERDYLLFAYSLLQGLDGLDVDYPEES